jgi:hypothetical protein
MGKTPYANLRATHPTLNHPNNEDLSLGTPKPQEQKRGEGGAPIQYLFRHFQNDPGIFQIVVIDRVLVDERIGQGVVVDGRRTV